MDNMYYELIDYGSLVKHFIKKNVFFLDFTKNHQYNYWTSQLKLLDVNVILILQS